MIRVPDIIIIKGAPGAGKSQASKALVKHFPKGVRVEVDTLRAMVSAPDWKNQAEHIGVLSISRDLALGFLRLGFGPVIVVDTFSGDKLNKYLADLRDENSNVLVRAFALVASLEELRKRLDARPADEFKDLAISAKLNSYLLKHTHTQEELIDTSAMSPSEVANRILAQVGDETGDGKIKGTLLTAES